MVSEEMKSVINLLKQFRESVMEGKQSIQALRDGLEQMVAMADIPDDVKCDPTNAGGVPAEWISTPGAIEKNLILYIHGGGWVAGSVNTHRDLVARISRASKTRSLIIDYRLAPEYPFPAGLNDCLTAYNWVLSTGIKPENLVIAGDSAGGNLTLASLIKLRDEGIPLPVAAVCLSPVTDLTLSGESYKTRAELDPSIKRDDIEFMVSQYVEVKDRQNPLVSPLYADLRGLPPLLIHVGTAEVLHDDSTRFAGRAKEAGVDVTLEIFEDMIHVFHTFAPLAPEGQEGIEKIAEFVLRKLETK
jgi:monoterpene epsilon-lactone hydrolase